MSQHANELAGSSPGEHETEAIHALLADGALTEAQAESFNAIHDRLTAG